MNDCLMDNFCESCGDCMDCYPHKYCNEHKCCEYSCLGKHEEEKPTKLEDK